MSSEPSEGSTNTIDQFLGDASGPHDTVQEYNIDRLRVSAYIVHRNFTKLIELGDNIPDTGLIHPNENHDEFEIRVEAFGRVHSYLSSLYSFNEQARDIINQNYEGESITKEYFLPGSNESRTRLIPEYIKKLVFLWGLRNQFTHGKYRSLEIAKHTNHNGDVYYQLKFIEQHYSPRPQGGLENAGDYLKYCNADAREYPLCYIGNFHQELFNEFENDLNDWCRRTLQS